MQKKNQSHTLRISINVKKVNLLVRFPCRLSFQLRSENGMVESMNTYQLKKGECQMNETIYIDLDMNFDVQKQKYQPKNIKVVIMMSSANGVIPAGSIFFNPVQGQSLKKQQETLNLDKCPDRSAMIKFNYWYQYLRTNNNPVIVQSNYLQNRSTIRRDSNINTKYSGINSQTQNNMINSSNGINQNINQINGSQYQINGVNSNNNLNSQSFTRQSKYSPIKQRDITPNRIARSTTILTPNNQRVRTQSNMNNINLDPTSPVSALNSHNYNFSTIQQENYLVNRSYMDQNNNNNRFSHINSSYIPTNNHQQSLSQNLMRSSKQINGLSLPMIQSQLSNVHLYTNNLNSSTLQVSQKAVYLKQIAKLRAQLKSTHPPEQKWQQIHRVKQENQTLTIQIELYKQKYRAIQKKDRQYNICIKQLKDQIQRLKIKLSNSQNMRLQNQHNLNDKDKKLKQSYIENKKLQQKISDLNIKLASNQKRIQFKENSLQQQLKKITQKYGQSETEIQKITFQYNSLLSKMQEQQKRYQLNIKQKQRYFNDQKNKSNKKIETLSQQYQKIKQQLQDKQLQFSQLMGNYKGLTKKQNQKQNKLNSAESQLDFVNLKFKKQQEQRIKFENQIKVLRIIEEQRNSLKKKFNQTISELSKTKQKLSITDNDFTFLTTKSKEQQELIIQLRKEKSNLSSKINMLTKQLQDLHKINQRRSRQQDFLSAQRQNSTQRMNDLKSKLQTQQRDYQDLITQYEQQLAYLSKAKEYTDNQIQDLKYQVDLQRQRYQQVTRKLKEVTEQVLLLNKELLQQGDKIKRLQQQLKDTQTNNKNLINDKLGLQQKQRHLNQTIKLKSHENYQFSKNKLQQEQQIYLLKQKLQQTLLHMKDRQLSQQKQIKQRQKQILNLNEENTKLQLQLLHFKEDMNSLNQDKSIKRNQIQHLKNNIQTLQERVNEIQLKNQKLREQIKNTNFELGNVKQQKDNGKIQFEKLNRKYQKLNDQWNLYRDNTSKALEQLILQISKDQTQTIDKSNQITLLIFPDMKLSSMQVQAIKKRNTIVSSYRQKIKQIQRQLNIKNINLQKNKTKLQEKQAEIQFILIKQKQKSKSILSQNVQQKDQLSQKLHKIQEENIQLQSQNQKLIKQVKKYQQIVAEHKKQIGQITAAKQNFRLQVKNLQEKILDLKTYQITSKSQSQAKLMEINQQSQQQIQKIKQSVQQNQRKFMIYEKAILQKQETIKRLQNQIGTLTYQRDRHEQKSVQLNEKLNLIQEQKKTIQKKVKHQQKQIKQQSQLNKQTLQNLSNQKIKLQQIKLKYNQTFQKLTNEQIQNQRLKQDLQSSLTLGKSLQGNLRQKQQKSKIFIQKSSLQIKTLKQQIITLTSELQLKDFIIKQSQQSVSSLKQSLSQTKEQLCKKKEQLIKLESQIQSKKNNMLFMDQSLVSNRTERVNLLDENQRLRIRINGLQNQLADAKLLQDQLRNLQIQCDKLKNQNDQVKMSYQRTIGEVRSANNMSLGGTLNVNYGYNSTNNNVGNSSVFSPLTQRRSISSKANFRQQQPAKRRIKQLQSLLELKHVDLALERKKWIYQSQRQKRSLYQQISQLSQQIQNLQHEFDFQRIQLTKQIQQLQNQNSLLLKTIEQKQQMIFIIQNLTQDLEGGNKTRVSQLKTNIEELKKNIQGRMHKHSLDKERRTKGKINKQRQQNNNQNFKYVGISGDVNGNNYENKARNSKNSNGSQQQEQNYPTVIEHIQEHHHFHLSSNGDLHQMTKDLVSYQYAVRNESPNSQIILKNMKKNSVQNYEEIDQRTSDFHKIIQLNHISQNLNFNQV